MAIHAKVTGASKHARWLWKNTRGMAMSASAASRPTSRPCTITPNRKVSHAASPASAGHPLRPPAHYDPSLVVPPSLKPQTSQDFVIPPLLALTKTRSNPSLSHRLAETKRERQK